MHEPTLLQKSLGGTDEKELLCVDHPTRSYGPHKKGLVIHVIIVLYYRADVSQFQSVHFVFVLSHISLCLAGENLPF
jgi:hypothetical protein